MAWFALARGFACRCVVRLICAGWSPQDDHRRWTRQTLHPPSHLDRVGTQPGPHNLASDRVQRMRHCRPGMHVQTNTRTLSEDWGLPHMSERPNRPPVLGDPRIVTRRGPSPSELSPPRGYPYRRERRSRPGLSFAAKNSWVLSDHVLSGWTRAGPKPDAGSSPDRPGSSSIWCR